jgi:hypothetical protein
MHFLTDSYGVALNGPFGSGVILSSLRAGG